MHEQARGLVLRPNAVLLVPQQSVRRRLNGGASSLGDSSRPMVILGEIDGYARTKRAAE